MKSLNGGLIRAVVSSTLLMASASALALPDIPFCPLGGPPGWADRLFDDDDHHYPPPFYLPPPSFTPHWGPALPYYPVPNPQIYPPPVYR